MILLFIAVEIWAFGALCAWLSARTTRGKILVAIVALCVAALGVWTVQTTRDAETAVFGTIR